MARRIHGKGGQGAQGIMDKITPDIVLRAYSSGFFPMAEASDDPLLFWV